MVLQQPNSSYYFLKFVFYLCNMLNWKWKYCFFLSGLSFTEDSQIRGEKKVAAGAWERSSVLTRLYHFQLHCKHVGISWEILESSPLHMISCHSNWEPLFFECKSLTIELDALEMKTYSILGRRSWQFFEWTVEKF